MKLVYSQQYEPLLIREAGFVVTMYVGMKYWFTSEPDLFKYMPNVL